MDGVFVIDKPVDFTSHDVVARVRRVLREKRVGHTGTLDPFATGVLVVMTGRATRLAQFLAADQKEYFAAVRLGYATTTGDFTGERLISNRESDWQQPTDEEIEAALASLRGESQQIPPMYSAKKVGGRKLYELARAGETIQRAPVTIRIEELEALRGANGALLDAREEGTVDLLIRVVCSAGTYVRVLAETIGERLETKAHLVSLRRTRAGKFRLAAALTLERLEEVARRGALADHIISPAAALSELPSLHLTEVEARRTRHGVALGFGARSRALADGQPVCMLDEDGNLLAIGVYDKQSESLRPRVGLAAEDDGR